MKSFFKKLDYHFLIESTNTDKALFSYKTARSQPNVKTNRMRSTKRNFSSICFIILTFCFSLKTSYKELI